MSMSQTSASAQEMRQVANTHIGVDVSLLSLALQSVRTNDAQEV
jgi:hypothetical protein